MIGQSPKGIRILGRGGVRLQQFARICGFHAGMKGYEKLMKQYAKQRKATEKNRDSKDDMFEIEISWTGETWWNYLRFGSAHLQNRWRVDSSWKSVGELSSLCSHTFMI